MQRPFLPFFLMLAAVPCLAQSTTMQSFPAEAGSGVPTYLNAEIVRVDRGNAVVSLRSESGDVTLTADSRALGILTALRPGAKVLVAYETVLDETGRGRRIVTYARAASPTSGEPGPAITPMIASSTTPAGSTASVRTARVGSGNPAIAAAVLSGNPAITGMAPETVPVAAAGQPVGGGLPFIGGAAVPSVGPISPYASTVPSVPTLSPSLSAVLPAPVAKAPLSSEDVGAMRAYAERDLDAAAVVLAAVANDIDLQWMRYRNVCTESALPTTAHDREWFLVLDGQLPRPDTDDCRTNLAQFEVSAQAWENQLQIALDAARRADVLPGRARETLARHRIER
jgi:hypothetical protein